MYKYLCLILISSVCFSQSSINKAELLIANKSFLNAENEMLTFLKNHPNDNEAIELLGDAYGHQKKWDKAIKQYKILVKKQPKNANYQYKYGGALGLKALSVSKLKALGIIGDFKHAFLQAAELDPNHIDARWALVEVYVSLPSFLGGSFTKALKYAEELEQLSKVNGYLAKGYVYEFDNEPELAEKFNRKALKVSSTISCDTNKKGKQRNALHYLIGKVSSDYNIKTGKGEKCLIAYISGYSAKDGVPKEWAYYRLAQIYNHKGEKSKALNFINKAVNGLPKIKVFKEFKASLSI